MALGLLPTLIFLSWSNYTYWEQLWQIRQSLIYWSHQISDDEYQAKAALALAKDLNFEASFKLLTFEIESDSIRRKTVDEITKIINKYNINNLVVSQDEKYIKFNDSINKNKALEDIVLAKIKIKQSDPQKADILLENALINAHTIKNYYDKVNTWSSIAEVYGKLNRQDQALLLLQQAEESGNKIKIEYFKADGSTNIAKAYSKLNQPNKAASSLNQALVSIPNIKNAYDRADALINIAEAYGKLNQTDKAVPLLEQALASANQLQYLSSKASVLTRIGEVCSQLNQPEKAAPLLKDVLVSAKQIEDSYDKADALRAIAAAQANLQNWGQALKVVQQCPSKDCEVDSLARILTVYAEKQHPELKEEEEDD